MTLAFTRDQIVALNPCSLDLIPDFGRRKTMNAKQALRAGVSIDNLLWVAAKAGRKNLCVRFALACAQRVAHLNHDPRVQAALDATQAWLDNPCEETALACRNAANAANASAWAARTAGATRAACAATYAAGATWAADTTYAAAMAARTSRSASAAAADAAAEASPTSRATYASAWAAEAKAQRKLFLEIFA